MEQSQTIIERKSYKEDCGKEIIKAIENRVYVYEPGVIYYKEMPVVSPFSVKIMSNKIKQLASQFENWTMILDLREAKRPDAKARRALHNNFDPLHKSAKFTAFYTTGFLLNTSIHFAMFGLGSKTYSVTTKFDVALKDVKEALR